MTIIDVRTTPAVQPVSKVMFSEGVARGYETARSVTKGSTSDFCYLEETGGDCIRVAYTDIDNMVLALNKAKELWNND